MHVKDRAFAERKLSHYDVDYVIVPVTETKINIFFGKRECVDVVRTFCDRPLNKLTAEQDFILGIMLGYDRVAQCKRFMKRKPLDTPMIVEDEAYRLNKHSELGIA